MPGLESLSAAHQRATRKMSAVQRTPVGKRILNVLRNLAWVVPLTILIWVYAEREQQEKPQTLSVPVIIKSERPDRIVSMMTPGDRTLNATIEGTRAHMDKAREQLLRQGAITITVGTPIQVGTQTLPALDQIRDIAVFADNGIIVDSVSPATITLQVDEVIDGVEVRPEVPADIKARVDGAVDFDPPAVRLRGPRSMLLGATPPVVVADITEPMLGKGAGVVDIPAVPLRLKEKDPRELVTITPSVVKARARLRSSTITYTISTVPVFISGPVSLLDKYRVNFSNGPFIPRVTVIGPEEQIRKIESREFVAKATLELRTEDARERPLPRAPSYTLPENVRVVEGDANRPIAFELVERARPE